MKIFLVTHICGSNSIFLFDLMQYFLYLILFLMKVKTTIFLFFNRYLAAPQLNFGHSQWDSLTNLILITAF